MTLGPLMVDVAGTSLTEEDRELLAHPLVGGVILFARNFTAEAQLLQLCAEIRAIRTPPLLIAADQEGGRVQRFGAPFARLPPAHLIGRQFDIDARSGRELARKCGWLMAAEMRAVGVGLSFAPVLDLDWGMSEVIGDRAFHRRAEAVATLAKAYLLGMREAGMAGTAKHFPGHGGVAADSHEELPVDRRPLRQLREDLLPYRRLIPEGLAAVMVAHVIYSEVDAQPAGFSTRWIGDILRGELEFRGAVFSDDLSMAAAGQAGHALQRARAALSAGCDMILICNDRAAVERVVERLGDHNEPVSQVRLARMHGRSPQPLAALRASRQWQDTVELLARLDDKPDLRLDA